MKYILYGAGKYMRECIDESKINYFDYIVDADTNKIGTTYLGKEIKSPAELLSEDKDNLFIVITVRNSFLYSIEYDLKQMGFKKGEHFDWIERLPNHYPDHLLWINSKSENWKNDEKKWRYMTPNGVPTERAELVSKIITWDNVKSVLDLGAGSEPIRTFLPPDIQYYPVDYKQITGNTMIYDFNQKQFPDITADVVLLIGVHGYVNYEMWLIDKAVNSVKIGGQFIVSFNYSKGNYTVLDFIVKYHDKIQCIDYAFRDDIYGIFKFRRII